ncbi:MAG: CPBP family intramembrane glutamic endopeptidase [Candidatus Brocadiia bacterium]
MAKKTTRARATPPPLPLALTYLDESRDFATGFLFILPLLVGYEIGLALLRSDVINWAHGITRMVFRTFGPAEPLLFAGVVATLMVLALLRADRLRVDAELYGLMLAESVVYACGIGLACSFAARRMLASRAPAVERTVASDVVLSVGAGVYEEVLFRVVLLGALYYALKRWAKVRPGLAAFLAIFASSVIFAACHHIGPYGEPLAAAPLFYRFGLGVLFAAIYIYRGLGIVVYTHALYDVLVSLGR